MLPPPRIGAPLWLLAPLLAAAWPAAVAADAPHPALAVSGGVESFRLKEIGGNGARLLSESGNRLVIGGVIDNRDRYDPDTTFLYHLEAAAYGGVVDYDGQSQSLDPTQSNLPFQSQTEYEGARVEALLGYRLQALRLPRPLELLGGLGVDGWNRRIRNGATADGKPVSGIEEVYRVTYGKFAVGMTDLWSGGWHDHVQAGVKVPFRVTEDVNLRAVGYDSDLTLAPGTAYSGFIGLTWEAPSRGEGTGNLLVKLYYEGLHLDPSPSKVVSRGGTLVSVWQPETRIDIVGLQLGYRFR